MSTKTFIHLAGGSLDVQTEPGGPWRLEDLCGFASRQNPKRAFLFVSKLLGKHIPVRPSAMTRSHDYLADQLLRVIDPAGDVLFIGFAETATGLGAGVFEACLRRAPHRFEQDLALFIQTTRYRFDREIALDFREEHSHSTGHLVYRPSTGVRSFHHAETVVLVDDELSTGKTCANFMQAFLKVNPHVKHVVLVSLLNWMSPERKKAIQAALPGLTVSYVAASHGSFFFTPNPAFVCPPMPRADGNDALKDDLVPYNFGRLGETYALNLSLDNLIARLALDPSRPVHVLADGEFMHPPYVLATQLEAKGYDTWLQSTTRSPVLPGLAIENKLTFSDHYGEGIDNHIYNLPADAQLILAHESSGPLELATLLPNARAVSYKEMLLCG